MTLRQIAQATAGLPAGWGTSSCSPVLTYHACYSRLQPFIAAVDNVSPGRIYEQLETLKKYYRFVSIDEFCEADRRRGLAAVTFDDGYKSVIDEGLSTFSALGIPLTIFINTLGLEGRTFWRHKVMYIIQNRLTAECEASFTEVVRIPGLSFHQYSKHPANDSTVVESELDRFLESRGLVLPKCDYLIDDRRYLCPHPLVSFGNHTCRHYVLASLSRTRQSEEIGLARRYLEAVPGVRVSTTFSAPFGEIHQVNEDTFAVLRDYGYRYLLLNRGGVNREISKRYGIQIIERFSVMDGPIGWQLNRHCLETLTGRRGLFF